MSDSESDDIPDVETCQKLTERFAEITGTDEACAQFYLQDRNWDLQVKNFFELLIYIRMEIADSIQFK